MNRLLCRIFGHLTPNYAQGQGLVCPRCGHGFLGVVREN